MHTLAIRHLLAVLAVALLAVDSGSASAAELAVDTAHSTMTAVFKQSGVAVESAFTRFAGTIGYDPARPEAASAAIDVQTGSWDMGEAAYNAEVAKPEWLDSAAHPTATFRSTSAKAGSGGQLIVTGTLTVKGKSVPLSVPVTVRTDNGVTSFDGTFNLSRRTFAIGSPLWEDVLEDAVAVKFHLVGKVP